MGKRARQRRPPDAGLRAPPGLAASVLRVGDDEFAVLEWRTGGVPGHAGLTRAEEDVLAAIGAGLSNRQIAARRGTSERTVANQVAQLLRKLGAGSRHELIARATRGDR